jgi:uncharacterized protein (DUF1015 family)
VAEIRPFRAVRYDESRAGPLETLVAPPYDVIGPEERRDYLARSPYNVVHLTLPDSEEQAGRDFSSWRSDGVLMDDEESLWALEQDYVGPDGIARTRRGLIAALRAQPYDRRVVLPHERTHRGPKEGRLRLLRAVRAQLEPIFLLHEGSAPFEQPDRAPDLEAEGAGSTSRLWRIDDAGISGFFADRSLLIADGHHRYETAVAYSEGGGSPFLLAVLVSIEDKGLEIFPTHRLVRDLNGRELPPAAGDPRELLASLEAEPRSRSVAVVYRPGGAGYLYGEDGELDVELVARTAPEVTYTASADEAIAAVDEGRAQAAFLLRPLRVEDVFAKAAGGETMPQKSTYFYPKLVSGLLFLPV